MGPIKNVIKRMISSLFGEIAVFSIRSHLLGLLHIRQKKEAAQQIQFRKKLDIFDIEPLSQELKMFTQEICESNAHYGISFWLKQYAGYRKTIRAYIEHGVYFGNPPFDPFMKNIGTILVPGPQRKEFLDITYRDKKIHCIGPFIHYATGMLEQDRLDAMKQSLGEVLLVFPSHSIEPVAANYDVSAFINYCKELGRQFDTILVCLYWRDFLLGTAKQYQAEGFKVVTAGHRHDPYFLSRLKSIIALADGTMSNDIGTHIGYCIYLNKPHVMYVQRVSYVETEEQGLKKAFLSQAEDWAPTLQKHRLELEDAFAVERMQITQQQRNVCERFWGTGQVRSRAELRLLLEKL